MFNINSIDSYPSYNDEFFLHDNYLDTSSELDLSELKHFGASSSRAQSVDMDVTPLSSSKSSSSESSSSESNFELDGPEADFFNLIQPVVDLYHQCISSQFIQLDSPSTSSVQRFNLLNQNLLEVMDEIVLDSRFNDLEDQQKPVNMGTISGHTFAQNIWHNSEDADNQNTDQFSWCHLRDSRESHVTLRLIGQFDLEQSYINTALARIQLNASRHIFVPIVDTCLSQGKNITSSILMKNTLSTSIENKQDETSVKHLCVSLDPMTRQIKSGSDGLLSITQPDGTIAQWEDVTFTTTGRIRAGSRGSRGTGTVIHMNGAQEQWQNTVFDRSGHIHPGSSGTKKIRYPDGKESVWENVTFESSGLIMSGSKGSLTSTYPDGRQKQWHDVTFDAVGNITNKESLVPN